ncbi:MFS transporter [Streptomyces sp. NPDC048629]|uniref:MFS transporter n=1 Tax=Streptomyces sp. NPDC048629 TaxID=3154824 RepID=UPI00342E115E
MPNRSEVPQTSARPEGRTLWRNRNFNVFWLGQSLSVLGGSISLLALPLLVLEATDSLVQMGAITAVAGAAGIVTGTFAGYVVDHTDRRRTMIVCDLVRAVALCALPWIWAAGQQVWLLYVLMAVVAGLTTVFDVGYVTAVADLVDTRDLAVANSRLLGTFAVGSILGPILAGLITAAVGAAWALAIDGASFLVSAASLCFVTFSPRETPGKPGPEGTPGRGGAAGLLREMFAVGLRFIWSHPALRTLTVLLTLLTFLTLGATDLLIYRVRHDLGQDEAVLGSVVAVSGLGAIAAAVLADLLRRRLGFGTCWLGAVLMIGLSVTVIGNSRSVPVIALAAATFVFGTTLGGVCSMTLRQQVTPDHLLGRVTSAFWTVHMASGPIGAAVLTVAASHYGVPAVAVGGGLFCLAIFTLGLLSPLRTRRPESLPLRAGRDTRR